MASERLTFTLDGRDHLSRVLGHAGDSAERLRRQMEDASDGSGQAILTLTQDADGRLHDLEGRFVSVADAAALMGHQTEGARRPLADWSRAADEARRLGKELKWSWLALTPAALPMAAALAPVASATAAAGVGMAALALAAGRQIAAMGEASKAEKKYTDAVEESGATSAEAVKAQLAYARTMEKLPPKTREAAAALSVFKDQYKAWSDSLSADTMGPVIKGLGVMGAVFPKLTPTVKTAAAQLDRLFTVAGGQVASPGFDAFMQKVDRWSSGALKRATDGLIHLFREASNGRLSGGVAEFMEWARAQGPAVSATLKDLGRALLNLLQAGSDVGVGMLTVVQALSHLVAAVPPGAITNLLQMAIAIKTVRIAAAGLAAGRAAVAAFAAQITLMQASASAAPGRLAALSASFSAMSRATKTALIGSGIGLLVIALSELAATSEQAPPDVDKLTTSLAQLGRNGFASGEAARAFGDDLSGLHDKVRSLTDPSTADNIQQFVVTLGGLGTWDSTPVKQAKENIDAIDKSLASLVSNGQADLAAGAVQRLAAGYAESGRDASEFTSKLDDYQSALDDAKFEQDLAAQSMGLFGQQALATKQKLDAQKLSADGLRQSIVALNDVNRAGLSAMNAFEASIDAAAKAAEDNGRSLRMVHGELDLNSEKARNNEAALRDLAAKTDEAATAAREQGRSWQYVTGLQERGKASLIATAQQMGLTRDQAKRLADQILLTPNKTAQLKGNMEDLQAKLDAAKKRLASVPDSRKAQVKAEISQLEAQIAKAKGAIASVQGKTVSIMVEYRTKNSGASDFTKSIGGYAGGGNPRPGEVAWVGEEGPELVRFGRGGAHVYDHQTSMGMVRQAGAGQDVGAGLVAGMVQSRSGVEQAARGMAAGVEAGVRAELQIASPSKKMIALAKDTGRGMIVGLTGTKAQIKAVAMDLVKDIWKAWEGQKTNVDSGLVKMVNREHAKLQALASKRDALRTKLGSAQALLKSRIEERDRYAADIRSSARSASGLSSLGLEPKQVTASSIKQGLGQKLSRLRQFTRWIGVLTKRGINKNLLREVLAMGPEEGYAYASALVGMSTADLKAVNSLQSQIDKESDTLGKRAAGTMYDAGVNSARGLVKGLQSQEKAVVDQMYKLAKAMEKAIKKALGIKSPSRVAHAIGVNFGQGLSGGTLASLPAVGRAVDAVAGRMAGIRPMPGRAAGASAGGGSPIYITVQGAIDPVSTAKQLQRVLVKLDRTNGGGGLGL
jgi:hypothetical protein